jgi:hypothetical protein
MAASILPRNLSLNPLDQDHVIIFGGDDGNREVNYPKPRLPRSYGLQGLIPRVACLGRSLP